MPTVEEYLQSLPDDRREALTAIREVILANLDKGYEESMGYGISYHVPHSVYPAGYHCDPKQPLPYVGLASQKNNIALYLFCGYANPAVMDWFTRAWRESGKKLDMGKACVRIKRLDDVPLDVVGEIIRRTPVETFIAEYEKALPPKKRKA